MLKLKVEDIINLQTGLNKIATLSEDKENKVPFQISYKVSKLIKKIQPELEHYQTEREKLLRKYGTENFKQSENKDKDGNPIMESAGTFTFTTNESKDKYVEEHRIVLSEVIEFPSLYKFKLAEFNDISLSVSDLVFLDCIIDDTEEVQVENVN